MFGDYAVGGSRPGKRGPGGRELPAADFLPLRKERLRSMAANIVCFKMILKENLTAFPNPASAKSAASQPPSLLKGRLSIAPQIINSAAPQRLSPKGCGCLIGFFFFVRSFVLKLSRLPVF